MALTRPRAYQIYDIDYKQSVRVVATSNITLSGGAPNSVDGVNLSLNDRILVTGQSSGSQNGIYYVTTVGTGANGTWARSVDTNATGELLSGTIVMVTEGTAYADTQWKLITNDPITIGSTALTFVQNYLANSISYGNTAFAIGSSNANATISVAGTSNAAVFSASGANITGYLTATNTVSGLELSSTQSSGDEGGQINLALAATNTTLVGNVVVDIYQNRFRIFEGGGTNRGAFIDLSAATAGVGTNLLAGGGGGTPGGSNTYVQFNDAGTFGGNSQFTYNKVTNTLQVGSINSTSNGLGTNILLGDDAYIGDMNAADTFRVQGAQSNGANAYIVFGNANGVGLGRAGTGPLTYGGAFTATANITGGNLLTGGLISATGAITGAAITGTSLTVSTGNITGGNIVNAGANGAGNIGTVGGYFNTVFAKATSAQYADVAEWYSSDQYYEPGTVVVFDGLAEVTIANEVGDNKVAGVVSTNPAYIMNAGIQAEYAVPVALTGRVPTRVIGPVKKGNMMVSAGNGYAQACSTPSIGTVIGKAIENFDGDVGIIEVVVGRM